MESDLLHIKTEKLERKRLKKLKRQQERDAGGQKPVDTRQDIAKVSGITAGSLSSPIADAKPQKEKKRKQQVGGAPAEGLVQPVQKKKKKKKDRGGQPLDAANGVADASQMPSKQRDLVSGRTAAKPAFIAAADSSMPKAEKEKKSSIVTAASTAAQWAAVGSHELARAGAPVQKALYAEDPAVTRMTEAAVQQWREERETAVTGCDIRPVTAFGQAGGHLTSASLASQAHPHAASCPKGAFCN